MTQIADKEIARKNELNKTLDFMCQQLEQLEVIDSVPKDLEQRDILINRALDVRSACMQYLAANIRHDATRFGSPGTFSAVNIKLIVSGKVFKTFFTGDDNLNNSMADLKSWIDNYRSTLSNIHLRVSCTLVTKVDKGTILPEKY